MLLIVFWAISLVSLVCWIMALVKIFQDKEKNGVLHGVIGILCSLWAFIWGWMNAGRLGLTKVMGIWTAALILSMVLWFAVVGAIIAGAAANAPK